MPYKNTRKREYNERADKERGRETKEGRVRGRKKVRNRDTERNVERQRIFDIERNNKQHIKPIVFLLASDMFHSLPC